MKKHMYFKNRQDAGNQLAALLAPYKGAEVIVYALPRGGISVAAPIADLLKAPLELVFAHKIGHPLQPEYAIAAISESGMMVANKSELAEFDAGWLEEAKKYQIDQMRVRRQKYLPSQIDRPLENKIAVIVDDGIATGLTVQAAVLELTAKNPQKIIVAVPVCTKSSVAALKKMNAEVVALEISEDQLFLGAVGAYYLEFYQVEDQEVIELLRDKTKDRE